MPIDTKLNDLFVNLLANVIWLAAGILLAIARRFIFIRLPAKRLWGLANPKSLVICTATTLQDTGKYNRPSTGIGQVRAIAYIITSLNKAYKKVDFKGILLSQDQLKQDIENDIIILGGVKNNQITRLLLDKLDPLNIILQGDDGQIYWQKTNKVYKGETKNGQVVKDYGIVLRMKNPFTTNGTRRLILFAGSHTFGTIAGAKFFCDSFNKKFRKIRNKNFCALVSCDVVDGYPVSIKLEDYTEFTT